jgi:hypothetical protein
MKMTVTSMVKLGGAFALIAAAAVLAVMLPAAPARADTQNNCVTMGPSPSSSFWRVTNNCSHRVIGKFCYHSDRYNPCGRSPSGFGPIGPGQSETVTGPTAQQAQWRVTYCNYDDFPGRCQMQDP